MITIEELRKAVALALPTAEARLAEEFPLVLKSLKLMRVYEFTHPLVIDMITTVIGSPNNYTYLEDDPFYSEQFEWSLVSDLFDVLEWGSVVEELDHNGRTIYTVLSDFSYHLSLHGKSNVG